MTNLLDELNAQIDRYLDPFAPPRRDSFTSAASYARWEYREDRFEVLRWLKAPRRGYVVDVDQLTGLVILKLWRIDRSYFRAIGEPLLDVYGRDTKVERVHLPRQELWRNFHMWELQGPPAHWRRVVADEIRAMRRMMDDARREA